MTTTPEIQAARPDQELRWIGRDALRETSSPVVKRAAFEQWQSGLALLQAARDSAARFEEGLAQCRLTAQQDGFAAGWADGHAAWVRERVEREARRQARLEGLKPVLVDTVLQALRHLLGELPPDARLEALAPRVLDEATGARRVRLVVAPSDIAAGRHLLERWRALHPAVQTVELSDDECLAPGDCLVEMEAGAIDGRLDVRLASLAAAITQVLPEERR